MKREEKIREINEMTKELLCSLFSQRYTEEALRPLLKNMEKDIIDYKKNEAIKVSYELLEEVKHECRRAQEAVA